MSENYSDKDDIFKQFPFLEQMIEEQSESEKKIDCHVNQYTNGNVTLINESALNSRLDSGDLDERQKLSIKGRINSAKAMYYDNLEKPDLAIKHYTRAIGFLGISGNVDDEYECYHCNVFIAILYRNCNQFEYALKAYDDAEAFIEDNDEYEKIKEHIKFSKSIPEIIEELIKEYTRDINANNIYAMESLKKRARLYERTEKTNSALNDYCTILKYQKSLDIYARIIRLYNKNEDYDNAVNQHSEALQYSIKATLKLLGFGELFHRQINSDKKIISEYEELRTREKSNLRLLRPDINLDDLKKLDEIITDGCDYILGKLYEIKGISFNKMVKTDQQILPNDVKKYLNGLKKQRLSIDFLDGKETYKFSFINNLCRWWQTKPKFFDEKCHSHGKMALFLIMKEARNFCAHDRDIFDSFSEQDIAFLFLIGMRSMFDLGNNLLDYEEKLLQSFFPNKQHIPNKQYVLNKGFYQQINLFYDIEKNCKVFGQYQLMTYSFAISQICLKCSEEKQIKSNVESYLKNKGISYNEFILKSLYQTFWYETDRRNYQIKNNNYIIDQIIIFNNNTPHYLNEIACYIYSKSI